MTRIMLIDDDLDIIDSLTMILEGNGYEVTHRTSARDLEAEVKSDSPDLIILDIIFPDDAQAGFKAARELSQSDATKEIPVLMLSAVNDTSQLGFSFSDKDISDDFMPVGAFLEKPVEPAELLARIESLLG